MALVLARAIHGRSPPVSGVPGLLLHPDRRL